MPLDVLTPLGQQSVADESKAARLWERNNHGWSYVDTRKDTHAAVDAVLVKGGEVFAVAETKCRYGLTEEKFRTSFNSEWLVTTAKIVTASQVAAALQVPLYGFLYLVDDDVLLTQRISDRDGQFVVRFRCDNTRTQRTVNGGDAVRSNAFIDMSAAHRVGGTSAT
jgi:hypothetical protein